MKGARKAGWMVGHLKSEGVKVLPYFRIFGLLYHSHSTFTGTRVHKASANHLSKS